MLREKLQLRLQQREKSMISAQDEELKALIAPNKTAAKIKKMLLIHKHMVAMEKMRWVKTQVVETVDCLIIGQGLQFRFHIWYIASSRGSLLMCIKSCPRVKLAPGVRENHTC